MRHHVQATQVSNTFFTHTKYTLTSPLGSTTSFVQDAATYFVETWMESQLPHMMKVWQNWSHASSEEKQDYFWYFRDALLSDVKGDDIVKGYTNPEVLVGFRLKDNPEPSEGHTKPLGTFTETMLRWLRASFYPKQLLVEPIVPKPSGGGYIDFIEVTGKPNDYSSMSVTLWEIKGSDQQASAHNQKIYQQINDYPMRFYAMANYICSSYNGSDPELKKFLRDMAKLVRNHKPQAHYGVFITHDANVPQNQSIVPNLHKYPRHYPSSQNSHTLAVLLIPNFKNVRLDVWRILNLA